MTKNGLRQKAINLFSDEFNEFRKNFVLADEKIDEKLSDLKKEGNIEEIECAYEVLGSFFLNAKLHEKSIMYYTELYELLIKKQEEENKRVHKGIPLYDIGLNYLNLNNTEKAKRYIILAQIEDVLDANKEANQMAWFMLKNRFGWGKNDFNSLTTLCLANNNEKHPQEILVKLLNNFEQKGEKAKIISLVKTNNPNFIDKNWLVNKYEELKKKADNYTKGKRLEEFIKALFGTVDRWTVFEKKTNMQQGGDRDLIIRNFVIENPIVQSWGTYISVECKNSTNGTDINQISKFIEKLRRDGCNCGILVSKKGSSGLNNKSDKTHSKYIIDIAFVRDKIAIIELTFDDLDQIIHKGIDIIELLIEKYEQVKFNLGEFENPNQNSR